MLLPFSSPLWVNGRCLPLPWRRACAAALPEALRPKLVGTGNSAFSLYGLPIAKVVEFLGMHTGPVSQAACMHGAWLGCRKRTWLAMSRPQGVCGACCAATRLTTRL